MLYLALGLLVLNVLQAYLAHRKDADVRSERAELLNRIQGAAVNWSSPTEVEPVPYIHPDDDEQLAVLRAERDG